MEEIRTLFLLYIIYSVLGWIMETIVCSIGAKQVADRGFLIGPICPIYGNGAILMTLLLKNYLDDPLVLFIMAVIICSIIEYLTSLIMEKLFHTRWWDYSNRLFNINGRICLTNAVCFGGLGILLLYVFNPFIVNLLYRIPNIYLDVIAIILAVAFVVDFILSFVVISRFTKQARLVKKDSSNEINKKVREMLKLKSKFYDRLIKAFPNIKINFNKKNS